MKSHDFLHLYKLHSNPVKISKEPSEDTTTSSSELNVTEPESRNGESNKSTSKSDSTTPSTQDTNGELCELQRRRFLLSQCSEATPGKTTTADSTGAGFFLEGWRRQLCRCDSCKQLYASSGLGFLLVDSDPVGVYEGKAERRPSTHDAGMAALGSSLDRVQQVEAFHRKCDGPVMASCKQHDMQV